MAPRFARAHANLAGVLAEQGRCSASAQEYAEAMRLRPADTGPVERLAWVLATCGDARTRNPRRAVTLAEQACKTTNEKDPRMLSTLAVAYAEAGRTSDAAQAARKALVLARASGDQAMASDLEARISAYERRAPDRPSAKRS